MRKTLRTIHLFLSLAVTPTLLLFAVGAVPIAHHGLNPAEIDRTTQVFEVEIGGEPVDARSVARPLAANHGVHGEIGGVVSESGGLRFTLDRIGQHHRVRLLPAPRDTRVRRVEVESETQSLAGFLIALHTEVGFRDGTRQGRLWRGTLVVVSLAMLGIVGTGVPLWAQRRQHRRGLAIALGTSASLGVLLLAVVRLG